MIATALRKKMLNRVQLEYWRGSFFNDLIDRIKRLKYQNVKLLIYLEFEEIVIPQRLGVAPKHIPSIKRTEFFTSEPLPKLASQGFKKCIGFHDNLAWWGVPQYVKIIGGEVFDITEKDEKGNLKYCQFNAINLNDYMSSNATMDFIKGMFKGRKLQKMDVQKLAMIGIIAVGAIFGLFLLM